MNPASPPSNGPSSGGTSATGDNMRPLARIAKHLSWIFSGKGYGAALSLLYLAIVTRALGPAGFGSFSVILASTLAIQTLLGFNIWQVLTKFGNQHIHVGNREALVRLTRFCTAVDLVMAIVGIAAAGLILWLGRAWFGISDALAWSAFAYAAIFMLCIRNVPRAVLRLQHEFRLSFIAEAVVPTVKAVGSVIALVTQPRVETFLLVWACAELTSTLVYWALARHIFRKNYGRPEGGPWLRAWKENEGLPGLMVASNLAETAHAVGQHLPILAVGAVAGIAEAGLYRLAHQLTQWVTVLAGFVGLASFTEMTHVYARKGLSELMPLFLKLTRIALLMFAILLPTLFLLGKPLLLIVSGSQFLGAYPFLLVLAVAACLQVISVSCEPMLLTAGRSRAIVAIRVAGASILIAALYFSLMRFGAMGAAGARAAAELATLCMLFGASYLVLRETRASG